MDYIARTLDLTSLSPRSVFLFGPRQTGKTAYLTNQLDKSSIKLYWSLLNRKLLNELIHHPNLLEDTMKARNITSGIVVIDEIQLLPELLNDIHLLIESTNVHFLLTGSSARKLRTPGVNMLGGRAGKRQMFPLCYPEIKRFGYSLEDIFHTGLLPSCFANEDAEDTLYAYVDTYLKEEIEREAVTRKLPEFNNFLRQVAITSGEILNYSNLAMDLGIRSPSVRAWFSVLSDTLLGTEILPYHNQDGRKSISKSKFYLFDIGVRRALHGLDKIQENTEEFGHYFENYIFMELSSYLSYRQKQLDLTFWHTVEGYEVDFVIGNELAIEVKTTMKPSSKDLKGLLELKKEGKVRSFILVCRISEPRLLDNGVSLMPWQYFLDELWSDHLLRN